MELRADGTVRVDEPGEPVTYGDFYVDGNVLFMVWDYGMMAYFIELDGDSLSLILNIIEFYRI